MTPFTIYPAIDLKNGRCVRLLQGRADKETVYGTDPVAMAKHWAKEGAGALHVVDLDGAFEGRPVQLELVAKIVKAVGIPVQCGGGARTDADVQALIDAGVARVVIGTRAWAEPESLASLARRFGGRIAVGIDAREGMVQIKGWTETTRTTAVDLARRAADIGIQTLIVTDTAMDGMLHGVNVHAIESVCNAVSCAVIASGGVSAPHDISALRGLAKDNLRGAIVGKALYEGRTTLRELGAAAG